MKEEKYYIYDFERGQFMRPNFYGYTGNLKESGLYDYKTALDVMRNSNLINVEIEIVNSQNNTRLRNIIKEIGVKDKKDIVDVIEDKEIKHKKDLIIELEKNNHQILKIEAYVEEGGEQISSIFFLESGTILEIDEIDKSGVFFIQSIKPKKIKNKKSLKI